MATRCVCLNQIVRLGDNTLARVDALPSMVRALPRLYGYSGGMTSPVVVDVGGVLSLIEESDFRSVVLEYYWMDGRRTTEEVSTSEEG
jgi:hypothetical protein